MTYVCYSQCWMLMSSFVSIYLVLGPRTQHLVWLCSVKWDRAPQSTLTSHSCKSGEIHCQKDSNLMAQVRRHLNSIQHPDPREAVPPSSEDGGIKETGP